MSRRLQCCFQLVTDLTLLFVHLEKEEKRKLTQSVTALLALCAIETLISHSANYRKETGKYVLATFVAGGLSKCASIYIHETLLTPNR